MASLQTTCLHCGTGFYLYGDGTQSIEFLKRSPSFDTDECCEAWTRADAERQVEEARAELVRAQEQLASLLASGPETVLGTGTVTGLRAYAEAHSIDLSGASRKADIEEIVFPHMTVAELKAHAAANDIDLGDATRKDDIIKALRGSPASEPAEVGTYTPGSTTTSVGAPVAEGSAKAEEAEVDGYPTTLTGATGTTETPRYGTSGSPSWPNYG